MSAGKQGFRRVSPGWRRRRGRAAARLTALTVLASMGLLAWAPAAGASSLSSQWPSPAGALTRLHAFLAGPGHAPRPPRQHDGSARGIRHQVPFAVTRAHTKERGRRPGQGAGQLPPYVAHKLRAPRSVTRGSALTGGFVPARSKLLPSSMTAASDLFQNPDGSFTRLVYAAPVNYRTASGAFAKIDTTLVAAPGGGWQEKAGPRAAQFGAAADDSGLLAVRLGDSRRLAMGLAGAAHVTGTVSGSTVTYPGVLAGTGLVQTATTAGLTQTLTLSSAKAPSALTFPLALTGLTATAGPGGVIDLVDGAGDVAWIIGQATESGLESGHLTAAPLTWKLVPGAPDSPGDTSDPAPPALQLTVPSSGPDLPVTITIGQSPPSTPAASGAGHPDAASATQTSESFGETGATFAQTGDVNVNRTTATFLNLGTKNSGTTLARPYLQFGNVGLNLAGDTLSAASLQVFSAFAGNCTAAQTFNAYPVNQAWTLTSVSFPGPGAGANMGQFSGTEKAAECTNTGTGQSPTVGQTDSDSLTVAPIQAWLNGTSANNGIEMRAGNETSNASFKMLDGTDSPHPPVLALTFTGGSAPQINSVFPPNNDNASSLTPELQANTTDPDNGPSPITYQFEVLNSAGTVVACSTPGGCSQAAGTGWISKPDWTVPSGDLAWGQAYAWEVQAWDGTHIGPGPTEFLTTQVPQPTVGTAAQNASAQGVSPGSDAYTTSVTDAQVATVGPALSIERDYDSAYAFPGGAFGTGWSSLLDMKIAPGLTDAAGHTDTVNVTYPDGEQVGFGQNSSGSFTAPEGRYATLVAVTGGGYTLTDKNDTVYTFTQVLGGGTFGISSIADALGNTERFAWNTASPPQVTTITSASGRALAIGWSTPAGAAAPHVATVTTSDVTPGTDSSALTWSYGYSGDSLAVACSPAAGQSCTGSSTCPGTTGCTAYGYTPGTAYPETVLGTGPHSYWRLDESSGAAAASSVLANEGTDQGTYTGVALGQPGPLAGSAATAAGFTGLSYVSLPMTALDSASYQSVALWFKTTATGGVLLGSARDAVGNSSTTSGPYTPNLYVGTDGALRGEFAQGSQNPISAGPVADGHWHMAVLTSAGSTQSLYLDGRLAGTLAGTVNDAGLDLDSLGAGFIGGSWPSIPAGDAGQPGTRDFYTGSISDAATWDRSLTAAEVSAMYQAGTTATGLLSQVTRPSGGVYAQVSYSGQTGAVHQVTDDNGGTWTMNAPTVIGSSQEYVGAVLGQDPVDYWRLGDTGGGFTPLNQVDGEQAVYSQGISQANPSAFPDSFSSLFNTIGTGSLVRAENLQLDNGVSQSVSLWFKTTAAGQVLVGASSDQITPGAGSTTTAGFVPVLYVGADGRLQGQFYTGSTANTISTPTAVNDGHWHNAVLTAGGDPAGGGGSQQEDLYLDGQLMAHTQPGQGAENVQASNTYFGAGFLGGSWPQIPAADQVAGKGTTAFYSGSMSDVAVYLSQLSAAQVAQEWNAAEGAAGPGPSETFTVTDPGGKPSPTSWTR